MTNIRLIGKCFVALAMLGPQLADAGVKNGDWKSGDFTDWDVDASQNAVQEFGVDEFLFPRPAEPGLEGGGVCMGNCAAFFATGGTKLSGTDASIFLTQNGAPPPDGTGELFLTAGVSYTFTADLAAVGRGSTANFSGGAITATLHSADGSSGEIVIAHHVFGQIATGEIDTVHVVGSIVPPVSDFYILVIEFNRDMPHITGQTPLNWIDNITLELTDPPTGGTVPTSTYWSFIAFTLIILASATLALRRRTSTA